MVGISHLSVLGHSGELSAITGNAESVLITITALALILPALMTLLRYVQFPRGIKTILSTISGKN
jgi:hypothetical protein